MTNVLFEDFEVDAKEYSTGLPVEGFLKSKLDEAGDEIGYKTEKNGNGKLKVLQIPNDVEFQNDFLGIKLISKRSGEIVADLVGEALNVRENYWPLEWVQKWKMRPLAIELAELREIEKKG